MSALPVTEIGPMIQAYDDAMKNKDYQRTEIGGHVRAYLRELKYADASKDTRAAYETVLARLALDHSHLELHDLAGRVGAGYLRAFLQRHWGDSAAATRRQRMSIVRAFFKWALLDGRVGEDPTATMRSPRRTRPGRESYATATLIHLVRSQPELRDQVALQLLCRMGLRKDELRLLRIRDVDLTRNLLILRRRKGGKSGVLPLALPDLRDDLYLHVMGDDRQPAEFLLYPCNDRARPLERSSLHRWFKRCLDRADLPPTILMHELRHSAADTLWRVTGDLMLVKELLGHESVGTTEAYLHPSRDDLAAGLLRVAAAWAEDGA